MIQNILFVTQSDLFVNHITENNLFQPLNYTNCILNCVSALWTLSETRELCLDTITEEYRGGLDDCKAYCEKNGATRLAFSSNNYCRCCTASSKLSFHLASKMYTLKGKYIYAPTTNCLPIFCAGYKI